MNDTVLEQQISFLWAKSNRSDPKEIHLLVFHLLESAAVALALWEHALASGIKENISHQLGLPVEDAGKLLAYWIGLHDIGKASPIFQSALKDKNPDLIAAIHAAGLTMQGTMITAYHSQISGKFIRENHLVPKEVDTAISGHHGMWNTSYQSIAAASYGDQSWDAIRMALNQMLMSVLNPVLLLELPSEDTISKNTFTTWFSGFICAADWIASNEDLFHYCAQYQEPVLYFSHALLKAKQSLENLGWIGWKASGEILTFHEMYPRFKPRPIQQQVIDAYKNYQPQSPFIMVVEAPTGIGKTEIAMYIADRWLQQSRGSGLYIAMPTQATSNQLYERSIQVLKDRYPATLIDITLAHGQALFNENLEKIRVAEIGELQEDQSIFAADWFQNNRKRTLLAPFGVGTVDQVFLSILQTRHFFVRLFGLANKVIIFDEVHAYDTYMNTLFHRLLEWLRSLGVSVIILSATLPESTRREILAHYCGIEADSLPEDNHYPRLTLGSAGREILSQPLEWEENERTIKLRWVDEAAVPSLLAERLADGGCAAVICNTVAQSQAMYAAIKAMKIVDADALILFHARFPFGWRKQIEDKVLNWFGKPKESKEDTRPAKAIVVATQVIEQSLDLDFDFMVTALAPVDLILQRAGRLHRHQRDNRPEKLRAPELAIITVDRNEENVPNVGKKEPFYLKSILLKTFLQLKSMAEIQTIASTKQLIDHVYGADTSDIDYSESIQSAIHHFETAERNEMIITEDSAGFTMIETPDYRRFLSKVKQNLIEQDEENPAFVKYLQAKTRDGQISMRLICLFQNEKGELYFDPEYADNVTSYHGFQLQKKLTSNEISISNIVLIKTILRKGTEINLFPTSTKRKYLIFLNGQLDLENFHLKLDQEIGLVY